MTSTDTSAVHRVESVSRPAQRQQPAARGGSGSGGGGGGRAGACTRCLRRHRPESCPFRTKQCFRCGRTGHIRAVCSRWTQQQLHQLEGDVEPAVDVETLGHEHGGDDRRETTRVPEDEVYSLFHLQTGLGKRRPPLLVDLTLDGQPVKMEVDTGAAVSVCSVADFDRLWPDRGPVLQPCSVQLKTYSEEPIAVLGQVEVDIDYAGQSARLPLVVVDGSGPCLFGRNWLEYIRLDWPAICQVRSQSLDGQRTRRVDDILREFPDVFKEELGCYTGGEVSIDVDPGVQPRFFKPRTVPLAYREEVDAQLEKGIKDGLWEPVRHSVRNGVEERKHLGRERWPSRWRRPLREHGIWSCWCLYDFMRSAATPEAPQKSPIAKELATFPLEPALQQDADSLAFWSARRAVYPHLEVAAKNALAVPASSGPSERVFSMSGKMFSPARSRLSGDLAESLMHVKCE
ncbi:uncharacterized protein FJT64_016994 [Amphibalanus amphitrite]|uniref:CCHC-type domain-containing protein n=1 Tax=Amphibalanus amphitrite TaxID=1232801 RepID=A0A6A4WXK4_AMPAM|nr:uncharacterized protein FJT64_016994 [Amphibalanus amphitrite]